MTACVRPCARPCEKCSSEWQLQRVGSAGLGELIVAAAAAAAAAAAGNGTMTRMATLT